MTPQNGTEPQSSSDDEPDGTSTLNILDGEPRSVIPKELATELSVSTAGSDISRTITFFPKLNRNKFVVECIVGGLDSHANQRRARINDINELLVDDEEKDETDEGRGKHTVLRWPRKLARTLGLYQLAEQENTRIKYYLTEPDHFEVQFNRPLKPWQGGRPVNNQLKPMGGSLEPIYRNFQSPEGGEGLESGRYRLEFPQEWAEAYDFTRGDTVAFHIAIRRGEFVVAIDHKPEYTDNKQTGRIQQYYPDNEEKGGRKQYALDIPRQVVHAFGLGSEIFDLEVTPEPGVIIVGRGDAICPECGEAFDTVGDIEIHLNAVHGIEKELREPRSVSVL